jgi:thiamine kinase-like enzyme
MRPRAEATYRTFTPERTRELLVTGCQEVGIRSDDAKLIRHQTNAVYLLEREQAVVKIARPDYAIEHIQRTVDLTRRLMGIDFPTVPLLDVEQPLVIEDSAMTFWRYLPQRRPITAADIAAPLRWLHSLPHPPHMSVPTMPRLDAISAIRYSLERERILSSDEHALLVSRCASLESALHELSYKRPDCLIHGDPQHGNTLWQGQHAVLCDWESASTGPAEWDLVTIEVHCRRFQHPEETYADFCRVYGRDVREWEGFETMRDVRELRMICTNARKSAPTSRSAAEVRRRVVQLQEETVDAAWSIL